MEKEPKHDVVHVSHTADDSDQTLEEIQAMNKVCGVIILGHCQTRFSD